MNTKRNICIEVYRGQLHDGNEWPPEDAREFLAWLTKKIENIPPEFLGTAKVEIGSVIEYDSDYATITISYTRPETDDEFAARRDLEDRQRSYETEQERLEYERLKKKFEPPSSN
jgi:hypothetical protein